MQVNNFKSYYIQRKGDNHIDFYKILQIQLFNILIWLLFTKFISWIELVYEKQEMAINNLVQIFFHFLFVQDMPPLSDRQHRIESIPGKLGVHTKSE